jgi:hypothetical protein
MMDEKAMADEMFRGPALEELPTSGLQVEEPLDVESIELTAQTPSPAGSVGWETSQPGVEPIGLLSEQDLELESGTPGAESSAPSLRERQLERENLELAAELAGLRAAATARERLLEARLGELAARTEELEGELTDQSAQIASLTLERDGLRARLETPAMGAPSRPLGDPAREERQVDRLKARLEERGRALAVARDELESLQAERRRLAEALAERAKQVARLLDELNGREAKRRFEGDFRGALRKLIGAARRRPRAEPSGAEPAPTPDQFYLGAAATDTVVMDSPPPVPAPAPAVTEPAVPPEEPRPEAPRRFLLSMEPGVGEAHELTGKRIYVGRAPEVGIRITDTRVSRVHAVLRLEGDKVVVEDAASTNGVYVNGIRVRKAELNDFDTVAFGSVAYLFRLGATAEESALREQ